MDLQVAIREARPEDSPALTGLTFSSKRHWAYPEAYFEVWKEELTITPEYIGKNLVFVAERDGEILGYYSIVYNPEDFWAGKVFVARGHWLEHIFILPPYIGKGLGTRLMNHAKDEARRLGCRVLRVFVDPFAKGFYEKIGARYVGESPSSIEGRTIPYFEIPIR